MLKIFLIAVFCIFYAAIYSLDADAVITTAGSPWQEISDKAVLKQENINGKADIIINTSNAGCKVEGFGGAFNEKGWTMLSALTADSRREVLAALFDTNKGCRFNFCRVPIGANDYAESRYTLDETKLDFDMKSFSIARDRERIIPYIKAAMEFRPDLKLFGTAWTPPTWMKQNGDYDGGSMKNDPKIYKAYALYLALFAEAYRAEGLNMTAVCVQNEPVYETHYPSCLWTPAQFLTFIRDYAGPLFRERNAKYDLWLGTLPDNNYGLFTRTVLDYPEARKYVSAVGLQWSGLGQMPEIASHYPSMRMVQTETECGNWYWKPGYNPDHPQNDWYYAVYTWRKVRDYMAGGACAYDLWNMILDPDGKSIDSVHPWPQDAAIVIDTNSLTVTYTPMFYAFKHYSAKVDIGAETINTSGMYHDAIAFLNPDGRVVVEICNDLASDLSLNILINNTGYAVAVPGKSFLTAVFNNPGIKK